VTVTPLQIRKSLDITPFIGEPQWQGVNPDFTADYIYCNNINIKSNLLVNGSPAGTPTALSNSIMVFITGPGGNVLPQGGALQLVNIGPSSQVPGDPSLYTIVGASGRVNVSKKGLYFVTFPFQFGDNLGGTYRQVEITSNWDNYASTQQQLATRSVSTLSCVIPLQAASGNYIAFMAGAGDSPVAIPVPNTEGMTITLLGTL
jgi:hypothetical protein